MSDVTSEQTTIIRIDWGITVTESYRAEVELAPEHAARLAELMAGGMDVHDALQKIEDETDNVFDLEELAAENEIEENQRTSGVEERVVQRVLLVDAPEGGVRGHVVQRDERGDGPFHGQPYHVCGKEFTEDGVTLECTDDYGHEPPCSQ